MAFPILMETRGKVCMILQRFKNMGADTRRQLLKDYTSFTISGRLFL